MRERKSDDGLTVNAVAGTHVVFFGLDLAAARRQGFRGFAFRRVDHLEGERTWLRGLKTFEATEPYPAKGETFSTRHHPIQSFQWADYSVKPGRQYTYEIVTRYGDPAALTDGPTITMDVTTEVETGPRHSAFFNRGSAATQEYARRFENRPPSKAGPGAYDWLSRGLLEALLAFIGRAGAGTRLHGAFYEFQWPAVLDAIRAAHQRGAKVEILFDDREDYDKEGKAVGPWKPNREAVAASRIKALCKGRANSPLMHNKFLILSENGAPTAVWTGSTNLTENGIFGHSNVGQIVEDPSVARQFLEYWHRLDADPELGPDYRAANIAASPAPPSPWSAETTCVFSPRRKDLDALRWYCDIARNAKAGLFMTFAFGMHPDFIDVFDEDDGVLKMALLEKTWRSPQTRQADEEAVRKIRGRPNVVVAVGNRIETNNFDGWLAEMLRIRPEVHVYWIHTKYLLADPLGETPIVVSGSANFSAASCAENDENMLVIRGDKRITDIFFGEYLRLYTHYAFREAVKRALDDGEIGKGEAWEPKYLVNSDAWMADYFDPNDRSGRNLRRAYFAGPMSI